MKTDTRTSLWASIKDELAAQISKGKLRPGDPFLSADDLSSRYKVSNITSRRVLDELAEMNLIRRVKGKGSFIKEPPACNEIFLVIESDHGLSSILQTHIYNEINKGILQAATDAGIRITTVSPDYVVLAAESARKLNVITIQGIFKNKAASDYISGGNVNCVCCHAMSARPGILSIIEPLKEGAEMAVEHLISKGHRRIAFMMPDYSYKWFKGRFEGYQETLMKHDLPFSFDMVRECREEKDSVAAKLGELLSLPNPPTAIFAATDIIALHVLKSCQERKIRVPGKMAVCGFDNRPECSISTPPLTSIDTQWMEQGRAAVANLLKMASSGTSAKERNISIQPRLVEREST